MNNKIKIIIIFALIIFVIVLDVMICSITDNLIDGIINDLANFKRNIRDENFEDIVSKSENLSNKWFKYENILEFFIEHDELEKVSSKIVTFNELIKGEEYDTIIEYIEETDFLLKHIKEKQKLSLKNIF